MRLDREQEKHGRTERLGAETNLSTRAGLEQGTQNKDQQRNPNGKWKLG
jgi:hypothetical protein